MERKQRLALSKKYYLALLNNDRYIIDEFYLNSYPPIKSYVLKNSGSDNESKDLFQEAFLAVWLNVKTGKYKHDDKSDIGAYLYQVAKFKWIDVIRSRKTEANAIMAVGKMELIQNENIDEQEDIKYLERLYEVLDEKCTRILELYYFQKMSLEDIAKELNYDIGSIRTIKYRCMMKLRKEHQRLNRTSA